MSIGPDIRLISVFGVRVKGRGLLVTVYFFRIKWSRRMLLPLPAPAGPRPRKSKLRSTPSTNAKLTRPIQSIIVGLVEICLADSNWAEKCLEHYHRCWLRRTSLPSLTPAKSDGKPSYRIGKRHPAAYMWWSNLSWSLQDAGFTYQQVTYLSITTHCRVVNRLLVDHYSAGIASTFILAGFNPWGIHRSDKITGINQSRWQIPNDLVCLVQCGSWSLWCSLVCDWIFSGGVGLHWYAQSVQLSALFLRSTIQRCGSNTMHTEYEAHTL